MTSSIKSSMSLLSLMFMETDSLETFDGYFVNLLMLTFTSSSPAK